MYDKKDCHIDVTLVIRKLSSYLLQKTCRLPVSFSVFFFVSFSRIGQTLKQCERCIQMKKNEKMLSSYLKSVNSVLSEFYQLQLSRDATHNEVEKEDKKNCAWTFCWANKLNKWKRVRKASKCKRFVGLLEIVHQMHFSTLYVCIQYSLFRIHCNQTKWDLDTMR